MKRYLAALVALGMIAAACGADGSAGDKPETLRVAYFEGWPTPNQYGQADGSFGDAVGVEIEWVAMDSGNVMAEAMEAGSIDIAYSQGLTPFANFVNTGADLRLVGIAVSYAEADNCIVSNDLGYTQENAADTLDGATVMTPIGNVTHYKMLSIMDFLGVELDSLDIIPAEGGASTAAAFEAGTIDVGCAFGNSIVEMLNTNGSVIMTGAEAEAKVGIFTYDIVAIPTSFGEQYPQVVTDFLAVTEEFNQGWAADPEGRNPIIAQAAGMEDVGNFLSGDVWFAFPTISEQLSSEWMGGNVAAAMKGQLETFERLGEIDSVLDDFEQFVDTSYLEAVDN